MISYDSNHFAICFRFIHIDKEVIICSILFGHDQLLCPYMDVHVLWSGSLGTGSPKISLVEEVHHKNAIGNFNPTPPNLISLSNLL